MKRLLFALYDTKGYMNVLSDFLAKKNFTVDCRLFTKAEALKAFLKQETPDVLLLGQEVSKENSCFAGKAKQVIVLSETHDLTGEAVSCPQIFKYQSAEDILQEIFQIVAEDTEDITMVSFDSRDTEFLGIYRPYGDPLPVQRIFSANGGREKKSLLINMEIFGSFDISSRDETIRGLSELIFYIKQKSTKLAAKMRSLISDREGIDYLYPVEDYRDLYSLDREDVDRLFMMLADETNYERVVFNIGFFGDAALYLLYCCDKVYLPRAKNNWEENQKRSLEALLVKEGLGEMAENIRYIS